MTLQCVVLATGISGGWLQTNVFVTDTMRDITIQISHKVLIPRPHISVSKIRRWTISGYWVSVKKKKKVSIAQTLRLGETILKDALAQTKKKTKRLARVSSYQQSHKPKHVERTTCQKPSLEDKRSRLKGREKFPR